MDRIARYNGLKNRSVQVSKYLETLRNENPNRSDIAKLVTNVSSCANYLVFNDYYTVDQLRLVKASTCKKSLLCAFCAARRAAKSVDKYLGTVEAVMASDASLKPVMITLTVKNGESLKERYNHLKTAYRALQKRRSHAKEGRAWTEFAKVQGAIHSYEFSKSVAGWHPHVHMVALLSDWIDQKALSAEWQEITGDSFIVDVRRIRPGETGLAAGMLEVFKYALKFQDLEVSDTWHAYETLKSRRLVGSFGNLRGFTPPESLLDDPLEGLPYLELVYLFRRGAYDLNSCQKYESDPDPSRDKPEAAAAAQRWTG